MSKYQVTVGLPDGDDSEDTTEVVEARNSANAIWKAALGLTSRMNPRRVQKYEVKDWGYAE